MERVEITKGEVAGKGYELWACNEFAMNMNAAEHENKITANLCQLLEKLFQSF